MKYVIGLTGNIGSGKSSVLRMLEHLGARVVDADNVVHELMRRGSPVWQAIVASFSEDILTSAGEIDRTKLGSRVFNDPAALRQLEAIVHPAVDERVREIIQRSEEPVVAVEAIKIAESAIYPELDALWLVTCPPDQCLERMSVARHLDEEDVARRLRVQMPAEKQAALADVIIDNGGTVQQTWEQVKREWDKIQRGEAANRHQRKGVPATGG
jgi:dephospho-CoA kinase